MSRFKAPPKENTLQSRLTIYSIFLILVTTFGAIIGAVILEVYQTQKDHEEQLQKALDSFQRDFDQDILNLEDYWQTFTSDPVRTSQILSAIIYSPSNDYIPIEVTRLSKELKAEEAGFYFPADDGEERLQIYYNRELQGSILILSEEWDSEKVLFRTEADGLINQTPTDYTPDLSDTLIPSGLRHELELWKGEIIVKSHLLYTNTSFEDMAISVSKGRHVGNIVLRKKTSISLPELERRMGVHITLFDLKGKAMANSIPKSQIDTSALPESDHILTIRDANGQGFNTIYAPIRYEQDTIGYVSVAVSQNEIFRRVEATIIVLLLIALLVILLGISISGLLVRRISEPLTELSRVFVESINSENISVKLLNEKLSSIHKLPTFLRGREFRNLRESFQNMMQMVENQTDTIESQNQSLEQKIKEIKQKNAELHEMNRLKDEFMANTSHELRTPLHGIIGLAESMLVSGKLQGMDTEKRHLNMIISSGRRLSNLINDVLDFYKMKEYGIRLQFEPLFLRSMVDAVLTISAPLADGRSLELINQISADLPPVHADESRLEQILYNLVSNAIKFTEHGYVLISAKEQDGKICISVQDTGIGIPQDRQKDIFELFTQVDGSISRQFPGTGIGLSIVKNLVELHHGKLTLTSQEGKGSCFTFDLPISDASPESKLIKLSETPILKEDSTSNKPQMYLQESTLSSSLNMNQKTHHILVIDDEPINLEILRACLVEQGYGVMLASGGKEALMMIEEQLPDLILLDLMMPGMSGYQVCQHLRKQWNLVTLPIIILSAKNQLSDLEEGFRVGANDYLTKPFYSREILSRVRTQLLAKEAVDHIKENRQLQEEIIRRKELEDELKLAQKRLKHILDMEEDAIVSLNFSHSIVFFNQGAETLFGYHASEVLGESASMIFPEENFEQLMSRESSDYTKQSYEFCIKPRQKNMIKMVSYLSQTTIDDEILITIIFPTQVSLSQTAESVVPDSPPSHPFPAEAISDSQVNNRINVLENAMSVVFKLLSNSMDPSSEALSPPSSPSSEPPSQKDQYRQLIVEIMNQSLEYWEASTGKTKIELAEESEIWKVNIDGGTLKTRTLDRYLKMDSLPKKPRVWEVLRTANFVIDTCPEHGVLKASLEQSKAALQNLMKTVEP